MKITTLAALTAVLFCSSIWAQTIEFIGPCSERPLFSQEYGNKFETVGDLTVHALDKNRIPYLGDEQGINSVFDTPVGMDALEVLSDTEMRSYGWCYFVDGKMSSDYANKYYLKPTDKKVQWIFGYARFVKDQWVSMCEKAYKIKPKFLCK
jgi:hypothetical protein